jgi:hypothetical protein
MAFACGSFEAFAAIPASAVVECCWFRSDDACLGHTTDAESVNICSDDISAHVSDSVFFSLRIAICDIGFLGCAGCLTKIVVMRCGSTWR